MTRFAARFAARFAVLGAVCILCGCPAARHAAPREPSEAHRISSFDDWRSSDIQGVPAETFLSRRAAFVRGGPGFDLVTAADGTTTWTEGGGISVAEMAVPVASDGYFLTVAHGFASKIQPLYVLVRSEEGWRAAAARVVFEGDAEGDASDVAILKADLSVPAAEWVEAATLQKGDSVAGVGIGGPTYPFGEVYYPSDAERERAKTFAFLAGRVTRRPGRIRRESPPGTIIRFDAPIRTGDSGGPFFLDDGRLVGIVVATVSSALTGAILRSEMIQPDLAWLQKTIADDRARHGE